MYRRRAFLGTVAIAGLFAGCMGNGEEEDDSEPENTTDDEEQCETEEVTEEIVYADEQARYYPGNPGEGFRGELDLVAGDKLTVYVDVKNEHRAQPTLIVEAPNGERLRDLAISNSFDYTWTIEQEGTYFVSVTNERPGTEDWGEWYMKVETVETNVQEVC
ncbi:MAG: hypothetical protein U5K37_12745 [Natrialbaceae archaeon]|nr:hypothetical protein [Natrialbaceae archaeon]